MIVVVKKDCFTNIIKYVIFSFNDFLLKFVENENLNCDNEIKKVNHTHTLLATFVRYKYKVQCVVEKIER